MIHRMAVWVLAVVGMAAGLALGQQVKQVVPADRSTPRGTLKVLAIAMEKGDAEQLRSILAATTPTERQMAEAMVQTAQAVRKLHDAAIAAYGAEQAKVLTGTQPPATPENLEYIDEATETIDPAGESATVQFSDVRASPVKLTRSGEEWSVPVGELAGKQTPAALAERLGEIQAFSAIIDAVADEIAQKKHRTAEEAKQALYNRMMQAAAPQAAPPTTAPAAEPPATGPTTAPAGEPQAESQAASPSTAPAASGAPAPAAHD